MKPYTTLALATLLLTSLAGSSAWAQCKPFDSKISLEPTKLGGSVGALGTSGIHRAADCSELFAITVAAKIANGETLTVVVASKAGTFRVGGVKMFDGFGQLVLDSNQDISDVFPIGRIESIQVIQATTIKAGTKPGLQTPRVLLEGTF